MKRSRPCKFSTWSRKGLKGLTTSKPASHPVRDPCWRQKARVCGVTHPHTGSTGNVAGSLVDSYTCTRPPGSGNHADICGSLHTHPYLCGTNIGETFGQSLKLGLGNHSVLSGFPTFTGLCIGIQREAALAVATEAPWTVLADAVGATQIGVCCTFIVVCAERREGSQKDGAGNLI